MSNVTFPKIGEKHTYTPFIVAKAVHSKTKKIPKKIIFIYSVNSLENKLKKVMKLSRYDSELGTNGAFKSQNFITSDKKLLVVKLPMGAPVTAGTVEAAIACGGKEFLILGVAGGIKKGLRIADIILCTRAIRDDGTSHHYIKNSKYVLPSNSLTSDLEKALIKNKIKFHKGTTWTIDAIYAETKEEIAHYRKEGVLTVEMEASALFAVAKKRGVKAAAIFTISDLFEDEWKMESETYERIGYPRLAEIAKIFKNM